MQALGRCSTQAARSTGDERNLPVEVGLASPLQHFQARDAEPQASSRHECG
jgi:hypothetical protein